MIELISSCPKDNGIIILYDHQNRFFIKSTYGNGRNYLKNEMLGFEWYLENSKSYLLAKNDYVLQRSNSDTYLRVKIKEYSGHKFSPYQHIEKKIDVIKELIDHYFLVWRRMDLREKYPIHGDFSVGNCVRKDGQIILFDWEHFCKDAAPFGFDVVNLYYESIFFSFSKPCGMTKNRIRLLRDLKLLITEKLNHKLDFQLDLTTYINYLNENKNHWGVSFSKLPALNFSRNQISRIYEMGL